MSPNPEAGRTFEVVYRELQQTVERLESGGATGLDLEDVLRLFERGTELAQACEGILEAAELRVTRLAAESAFPLADSEA